MAGGGVGRRDPKTEAKHSLQRLPEKVFGVSHQIRAGGCREAQGQSGDQAKRQPLRRAIPVALGQDPGMDVGRCQCDYWVLAAAGPVPHGLHMLPLMPGKCPAGEKHHWLGRGASSLLTAGRDRIPTQPPWPSMGLPAMRASRRWVGPPRRTEAPWCEAAETEPQPPPCLEWLLW